MERIEPSVARADLLIKVWSVAEYCKRHRIDEDEQQRLIAMFGAFAPANELLHNARRVPKFR